jgi:hypothetical protein
MTSSRPAFPRRPTCVLAGLVLGAPNLLTGCGSGEDAAAERRAAIVNAPSVRLGSIAAQHTDVPGIVVQVLDERSGLSWAGSAGVADRGTRRPLTPNAAFRTASVTKVFTAAAIHRLHAHGEIAVSDAIERHLSPQTVALLRGGGYDTARITADHPLTHRWTRPEQLAVAMSLGAPLVCARQRPLVERRRLPAAGRDDRAPQRAGPRPDLSAAASARFAGPGLHVPGER